jgi:hypothetical protein
MSLIMTYNFTKAVPKTVLVLFTEKVFSFKKKAVLLQSFCELTYIV